MTGGEWWDIISLYLVQVSFWLRRGEKGEADLPAESEAAEACAWVLKKNEYPLWEKRRPQEKA